MSEADKTFELEDIAIAFNDEKQWYRLQTREVSCLPDLLPVLTFNRSGQEVKPVEEFIGCKIDTYA